jgi:hypothetical protein
MTGRHQQRAIVATLSDISCVFNFDRCAHVGKADITSRRYTFEERLTFQPFLCPPEKELIATAAGYDRRWRAVKPHL